MPTEQDHTARLAFDPHDIEAILGLCAILIADGRPIAPEHQEAAIQYHLAKDPQRHDLAFQLSNLLMQQGRAVPSSLEESALRHAIAIDPGRLDLYDRFVMCLSRTACRKPEPSGCGGRIGRS